MTEGLCETSTTLLL